MSNSIPTMEEISQIVQDLNGETIDLGEHYLTPFTFNSNGFECMVEFMGVSVWNDADEERDYGLEEGMWHSAVDENGDEMREDLKEFLLKEAREITIALSKFLQEEV